MASVLAPAPTHSDPSAIVGAFDKRLLIGGEWVDAASGDTLDVLDPSNRDPIASVAAGDAIDVARAVSAARTAFEGVWGRTSVTQRARLVWRLGELIDEHAEEFAALEALDNGKPVGEARAIDIPLASDCFRYMAGWATKLEGSTMSLDVPYAPDSEYHAFTLRQPVGVVGQIIPWNFPLMMAAWKLAPALTCGCAVVLKPAEQTPLSALRLAELATEEGGFPPGAINVVTGFGETAGAALASHPDVDKIAFTGSTEVGKLIVEAAGRTNLKKVSLELGGKSPNLIFDDASIEAAVAGTATASFLNQGEVCTAGSRIYVADEVFDDVASGLAQAAESINLGPGLDGDTSMGALVSDEQHRKVTEMIESGIDEGAEVLAGTGGLDGSDGYFVRPTVLASVKAGARVQREEIFGPVITVSPFSNLDDVIAAANDTEYGLAAGVWTENIKRAHRVAKRLKAGTVYVNCYHVLDAALPFGGFKQSGWGRELGKSVLNLYTETQAVCVEL